MRTYSKIEERFLKYIGYRPDAHKLLTWKDIIYTGLESYAFLFVSMDHVFKRGLDIEEATLSKTGDIEQAWEAAEPFYKYAGFRGHAEAAYRCARWAEQFDGKGEFIYPFYLEKAVKLGHKQAMHDYVYNYDEFKVKTITKDAWRRKKRQEKTYFHCCKELAEAGDSHALWELGACYLFGTGVKKDGAKGVVLRDLAMQQWELDEDERERLSTIQDFFAEEALKNREPFTKYAFKTFVNLFISHWETN